MDSEKFQNFIGIFFSFLKILERVSNNATKILKIQVNSEKLLNSFKTETDYLFYNCFVEKCRENFRKFTRILKNFRISQKKFLTLLENFGKNFQKRKEKLKKFTWILRNF